jgi:hypothetical protein
MGGRGGKALVLALLVAAGGESRAQPGAEEPAPPAPRAAGTYQGVAPAEGAARGAAERHRPRAGGAPRVTWLGFQPTPGGGARVFVRLDRDVRHAERVQDGALVVSLGGARAARANTRRFLDTRFFDTPVERVALERARARPGERGRGRGLELVIRFKSAAGARPIAAETSAGADGFTYLLVDVPGAGAGAEPE